MINLFRRKKNEKVMNFHNTIVGISDGRLTYIKFPGNLTINFFYDTDNKITEVINHGHCRIHNVKTIDDDILSYGID